MNDFGVFACVTIGCVTLLAGVVIHGLLRMLRQQRYRDDTVRYHLTFAYLTAMKRVYRAERPQPPTQEDMQHEFPA